MYLHSMGDKTWIGQFPNKLASDEIQRTNNAPETLEQGERKLPVP